MKQNGLFKPECSWHAARVMPDQQTFARCFPALGERCPGMESCQKDLACRLRNTNDAMRNAK